MLPFIHSRKKMPQVMVATSAPTGAIKMADGGEAHSDLQSCMEDFLMASKAGDTAAMAQAFEDAFDCLEMQPHDEVAHEEQE